LMYLQSDFTGSAFHKAAKRESIQPTNTESINQSISREDK
jgi:hypothetical protein